MTMPLDPQLSPFASRIGMRLVEAGEGMVRISLQLEEKHTNPNGVMHGGVATTLMDEALSLLISSFRGVAATAETPHVPVDMSMSFIAGPRIGDEIVAEARALKVGRLVAFGETEITRPVKGGIIAKGRFTFLMSGSRNA